jgi:uncharacterized cupredoxin-like copper-binding protein
MDRVEPGGIAKEYIIMHAQRCVGGIGLLIALALAGCGGTTASGDSSGTNTGGSSPASLEVSADPSGQLKFQPEMLNATAGQPISVSFKNPAPLQHNWVLVTPGQEQAVADAAAGKGGDATGVTGVIALTPMLNANGEETREVPSQEAGTYTYICTVPGHYAAGMRGTLTVK